MTVKVLCATIRMVVHTHAEGDHPMIHTKFYVDLHEPSIPQDFKDASGPACSVGEGHFYYNNTRFGLDRGLGLEYAHLGINGIPEHTPEVLTRGGIPISSIWISMFGTAVQTALAKPGQYYREVYESGEGTYNMTVSVAGPNDVPAITAIGKQLDILAVFLNEVLWGLLEPNG